MQGKRRRSLLTCSTVDVRVLTGKGGADGLVQVTFNANVIPLPQRCRGRSVLRRMPLRLKLVVATCRVALKAESFPLAEVD